MTTNYKCAGMKCPTVSAITVCNTSSDVISDKDLVAVVSIYDKPLSSSQIINMK